MDSKRDKSTSPYPTLLIVDDDEVILDSLSSFLRQENWDVICASTGDEALQKIRKKNIELVISDISMSGMDGVTLLKKIKEINPEIEVIIMTAFSSEDSAVRALKAGAFDYFRKPFHANGVKASLLRTNRVIQLKSQNTRLKALVSRLSEKSPKYPFIGNSKTTLSLLEKLKKIASTPDATVLISGESGVGKEVAARTIHQLSKHAEGPFVAINCGGISEGLLQRELFGHEKGAFTGADKRSPGVFEMALGGTILLDEISELSSSGQSTLLRTLDERCFRRVGGSSEVFLKDTRIIACTNKSLEMMVAEKKFRSDLYFRLHVVHIAIPSLLERKEDILFLANYYLQQFGTNPSFTFSTKAEKALQAYEYPGNIRELKNIIQHAIVFKSGNVIQPSDFSFKNFSHAGLTDSSSLEASDSISHSLSLRECEIELITKVLKTSSFNYSSAARTLGISPQALHRKLKKYNITKKD